MSTPWKKRYTVRVGIFGTLYLRVSQYVPDDCPGMWTWTKYRDATQDELKNVVQLITRGESK